MKSAINNMSLHEETKPLDDLLQKQLEKTYKLRSNPCKRMRYCLDVRCQFRNHKI